MAPSSLDDVSLSRRSVLLGIGGLGLSYFGISELATWYRISNAGADPDEYVPENCGESTAELVQTYGPGGEPDRTKEIPAERHRRLTVHRELPFDYLEREYDGISEIKGMDLTERSDNPCDLAIVVKVDELGGDHPDAIDGVPVVYEYEL